jgi:hypothetical protein
MALAFSPRLRPGQNRLRSLLLDPEEQAFQQDWTRATADFIAALRTTIGDDTDNPRFVELVGELALSSQRFRTLWARHDVRSLDGGTTTVHHPVVGELRLHRDKLPVDDVILVVYYPDKNSDSDEKLQLLAARGRSRGHVESQRNENSSCSRISQSRGALMVIESADARIAPPNGKEAPVRSRGRGRRPRGRR